MTHEHRQALLIDDNLMSSVKVQTQLEQMNYGVHTSKIVPDTNSWPSGNPELILINLGSRSLEAASLIPLCQTVYPNARIVGFCGHREVDIRMEAKAAGIAKILTNEQVMQELSKHL